MKEIKERMKYYEMGLKKGCVKCMRDLGLHYMGYEFEYKVSYTYSRSYSRTILDCEKALYYFMMGIENGNIDCMMYAGDCYVQLGKYEEAKKYYVMTIEHDKNMEDAYAKLRNMCLTLRQYDEFIKYSDLEYEIQSDRKYFAESEMLEGFCREVCGLPFDDICKYYKMIEERVGTYFHVYIDSIQFPPSMVVEEVDKLRKENEELKQQLQQLLQMH